MSTEMQIKRERLAEFLERHQLDGVLLWQRNNFAWVTGGRDNHIANNAPQGVAAIFATPDRSVCLASSIEAPRMQQEELAGSGIEVVSFPWWDADAGRKVAREVLGGLRVACDGNDFGLGLPALPGNFAELRWSLTEPEIARYRDGAHRTSRAMEHACREIRAGMNEHEIAGVLDHHVHASGCNPIVTLVAADQRIRNFRHPIPTKHKLERHVMLVTCAEFGGLVSCLTRFVHFGPLPDEQKQKQQSIANIDAAVNLATRPGRTLGQIFRDLQKAYADNGHEGQWQNHHQGGSTGYAAREVVATPSSEVKVLENQAFAWNPSIVGAKSEDTMLCTARGIEVLTQPSAEWPSVTGEGRDGALPRAGILER